MLGTDLSITSRQVVLEVTHTKGLVFLDKRDSPFFFFSPFFDKRE